MIACANARASSISVSRVSAKSASKQSPEEPRHQPRYLPMVRQLGCAVGNVHYRSGREPTLLCICFGKVKSDARLDQLIKFTRLFGEALPIKYRGPPAAGLNQTCAFQLTGSIRDGWPLNTEHF